ncbi:hypothetical protein LJC33_08400 [Eubacteriales bacterium OttesenSCG-928-N13]|nr:hypothetical protein [Eubacteriales bacterium OttesenSCG-928-N13]
MKRNLKCLAIVLVVTLMLSMVAFPALAEEETVTIPETIVTQPESVAKAPSAPTPKAASEEVAPEPMDETEDTQPDPAPSTEPAKAEQSTEPQVAPQASFHYNMVQFVPNAKYGLRMVNASGKSVSLDGRTLTIGDDYTMSVEFLVDSAVDPDHEYIYKLPEILIGKKGEKEKSYKVNGKTFAKCIVEDDEVHVVFTKRAANYLAKNNNIKLRMTFKVELNTKQVTAGTDVGLSLPRADGKFEKVVVSIKGKSDAQPVQQEPEVQAEAPAEEPEQENNEEQSTDSNEAFNVAAQSLLDQMTGRNADETEEQNESEPQGDTSPETDEQPDAIDETEEPADLPEDGEEPGDAQGDTSSETDEQPDAIDETEEPADLPEDGEEPGDAQDDFNVRVERKMPTIIRDGDTFTLTAILTGFESTDYELLWQYNAGEGWQDVENESGLTLTVIADEENVNYDWRVLVVMGEAN